MNLFLNIAIVIWLYMTIVFLWALLKKDNSIVDFFWGLGFILISFYSLINSGNYTFHNLLLNFFACLWGIRLSVHIWLRNKGKPEDFRYKTWRDNWKYFIFRSYFQIFMLQGLFMLIIASPLYYASFYPSEKFQITDYLGIFIYLTGFIFETFADYQLKIFKKKKENHGKIITTGLWKITRHPNYFGESLVWWGIFLMVLGSPGGWLTIASPVVITLLLRFISGVPLLEKKYEGRKDWEEYKRKTAAFFPFVRFL